MIDRRVIYLIVFLALSVPMITRYSVTPARMQVADEAYQLIESMEFRPGEIAFISFDFGPNTKAENEAQAMVILEHLFRKRVPVVLFSLVPFAEAFLQTTPEDIAAKLAKENPGEYWSYGEDWVNLGFRYGATLLLQQITKSDDLKSVFKTDINGTNLNNFAMLQDFQDFKDIKLLAEFTGYKGMLDRYLGFFTTAEHRPVFIHGCTSISIAEAYIYLDSGQLASLLEGVSGAAWYSERMSRDHPGRESDQALQVNTGLGVAQLLIILLIIAGNLVYFQKLRKQHNA